MTVIQQRDAVRAAMASVPLTELEEQALWVRISGRRLADLARAERVPESTVRDCLARAMRKIKKAMPGFSV